MKSVDASDVKSVKEARVIRGDSADKAVLLEKLTYTPSKESHGAGIVRGPWFCGAAASIQGERGPDVLAIRPSRIAMQW